MRPGDVFAPMHWTGETAPTGRVDALVASVVDPVSGKPESKAAAVHIAPFAALWHGFAVSSTTFRPKADYWAIARTTSGMRAELAGLQAPDSWEAMARTLFNLPDTTAQSVIDRARGIARIAFCDGPRVLAALFVSPEPVALSRGPVAGLSGGAGGAGYGARHPDGPSGCRPR